MLFTLMGISFLGYVLPWGRLSLWGARVITNFLSVVPVVGPGLVAWLWAGYSLSLLTLKFFFALHVLGPLFLLLLVLVHFYLG